MRRAAVGLAVSLMIVTAAPVLAGPDLLVPPAPLDAAPPQIADELVPGATATQTGEEVEVADNAFRPQQLTVAPGTTVTWRQSGANGHSVTADDGSFDSHPGCPPTCMRPTETYQHRFDQAGRFPYYCRLHGGPGGSGMSGVVVVQAAPAQAGQPSPAPSPAAARGDSPPGSVLGTQDSSADPLPTTGGPGLAIPWGLVLLAGGLAARARLRSGYRGEIGND